MGDLSRIPLREAPAWLVGLTLTPPAALLAGLVGLRLAWRGHTTLGGVVAGAAMATGTAAAATLIRLARASTRTARPRGARR